MEIVDSMGNVMVIHYAECPRVMVPLWSIGVNKLFDFLEECERECAPVRVADSRVCAVQTFAVPVLAN